MQYVLAEESLPDQALFKHTLHTNCISIQQSSYISLLNGLCACVHVKKKMVLQRKPQLFSEWFKPPRETSNLEKSDGLVHCSVENVAAFVQKPS